MFDPETLRVPVPGFRAVEKAHIRLSAFQKTDFDVTSRCCVLLIACCCQ
jgi:hypothetical protein